MMVALAWVACIVVAAPMTMLVLECLAGSLIRDRPAGPADGAPAFVVLMPAHNEATGIGQAIGAIKAQLRPCDRLIVVADNCADQTAMIASDLGATVVERHDARLRGKGYALEAGRAALRLRASEIVIIVDADCSPSPGALLRLASTASERQSAVQGAYLLTPRGDAAGLVLVSCFAFLVKNLVRQLGLQRLSGLALLQGSGMAFPSAVFDKLDFCPHSLVEDLHMGLNLVIAGQTVIFEPDAVFLSGASSVKGTADQRRRWEHGVMGSAGMFLPRLIRGAFSRPSLALVALDLAIPPIVPLVVCASVLLTIVAVSGPAAPALLLAGLLVALGAALMIAWERHGRAFLPGSGARAGLSYIGWKLPIAAQFVTRRQRQWNRTEREP